MGYCNHEELIKSANKFTCWQCGEKFFRVTPAIYETSDRPRLVLRLAGDTLRSDVTSQTWERVPNEPGHWRDPLADMAERIDEFRRGSHQQVLKFNPSFRPGDIVDVMDDNGEYQFGGRILSRLPKDRYLLINGQVVREVDLRQHQVEFFGRGLMVNPRFQPSELFFFDAELGFLTKFGLVIPRVPGTLVETDHGIYRLRVYDEEKVGWYVDCVKAKQGAMTSWAGVPPEILSKAVAAGKYAKGRRSAHRNSAKRSLAARLWNVKHKEEYNKRMREYMRDYRKLRFRS